MRWRQWWLGLSLFLCMTLLSSPVWGLSLIINGEEIITEVQPTVVDGRVLVPLRSVMEYLDAFVDWQPGEGMAIVGQGNTRITLKPGEAIGRINGVAYPLDVPTQVIAGRIFIPLRFVSEALGAELNWGEATGKVEIRSGKRLFRGEIWGYYIDTQSFVSLSERQEQVTRLFFNSYEMLETGEVVEKVYFPQGMELAKNSGMTTQAMVFLNNRAVLTQILGNEQVWHVTSNSLLNWLGKRGYTGVHLDLEGVAPSDRENLTGFVSFLRNSLAEHGYNLSLALPAKTKDKMGWFEAYDYKALGELADRIVLMAYDQHYPGSEAGPVAGLDWVEKVVAYAVQEIQPSKILLGLGIYGYDWPQGGTGRGVDLSQVTKIQKSFLGENIFDQQDYSPGYRYQDGEGVWREVWYESPESLIGKLELVQKYKLQGVALWRLGIIPPEIWDIFNS